VAIELDTRLKSTAYHEAGHAALADYYSVLMNVRLLPHAITYHYELDDFRAGCIAYGGVLAEARFQETPYLPILYAGGLSDRQKIWRKSATVAFYLKETPKETRKRFRKVARGVLNTRWAAVELIAFALLQRHFLTRHEVEKIVETVTDC
jgi:hypothetical protein